MKSVIFLMTISVFTIFLSPIMHDIFAIHAATSSATLKNGSWETKVNKQVQITSNVINNQDRSQPFAYLAQIQNQDGVTVSLSWISGSLDPGQSLNPSQSWIPTMPGTYNAQIFVWAGINNPDALSVPLIMKITVT